MEPNQFEKEIQKKFLNREIKPSKASWEKLEEKLPESPDQKSFNNRFYWFAAAAVLMLFFIFYNPLKRSVNTISIEEIPVVKNNKSKKKAIDIKSDEEIAMPVSISEKLIIRSEANSKKQKKNKQQLQIVTVQASGMTNRIEKKLLPKPKTPEVKNNTEEANAVASVLKEAKKIETAVGEVSEADIDQLIQKAQNKIKRPKPIASGSNSKAAMVLLDDIEQELDRSFRDKVYDLLKKGMVKVRTAVAERKK